MAVQNSPVNIFIAYSREDKTYLEEFRKHLSPLKKRGIIKLWDDAEILPGTEWDTNIKVQLEASQIVLLLVSPDFLASNYINQVELPKALARQEEGKATVIPVILRRCGWEYSDLSELQALPEEGLPVSNWGNHDDAYYDILTGVKKVVDRIRAIRLAQGQLFPHKDIPKPILYEVFIAEGRKLKIQQQWHDAALVFEKALAYHQEEFVPNLSSIEKEIQACRNEVDYAKIFPQAKQAFEKKLFENALELLQQAQKLKDSLEVKELLQKLQEQGSTPKKAPQNEAKIKTRKPQPTKPQSNPPSTKGSKPKATQSEPPPSAPTQQQERFQHLTTEGIRLLSGRAFEAAKTSFEAALQHYQAGFTPTKKWLEEKISACNKELTAINNALSNGLRRNFQGDLVGIISGNGQQIVPPIYSYIGGFRDNLALVKKGIQFGYIDPLGNTIIPIIYDDGESFSEGRAKVIKNGKIGYIDQTGEAVTKFEFEVADSFSGGIAAVVKNGKKMIINRDGELVTNQMVDDIFSFSTEKEVRLLVKRNKKGIFHSSGKMLTEFEYDEIFDFCEGFAVVEKNGVRGHIDLEGNLLNNSFYDTAVDFSEGFAAVGNNDQFGYIDTSGKLVIDCEYDYAEGFKEGFALVGKNNNYGYINTKGEMITGLAFDSAVSFSEGLAAVGKGGKGGYINTEGKIIVPLVYETAKAFSGGLGQVVRDGKHGYVNKKGTEVIPCEYEGGTGFNEGLAGVLKNGKFGFVNIKGQVVIPFNNFNEIKWFSEGYAAVKKTGFLGFGSKWGFIDKQGNEVFPFIYNEAGSFKNGRASVVYKNNTLVIEKLVI